MAGRTADALGRLVGHLYEAVEYALAAGFLKFDFQLIAFLLGNRAVTELLMKHARANGEVGARFGGKAGGAARAFGDAARFGIEFLPGCPLPTGTACNGTGRLGASDIGEGIGMFGPLRTPERRTAGQRTVSASSINFSCSAMWRFSDPVAGDAASGRPA